MDISTLEEASGIVELTKLKKIEKLQKQLNWMNTYPTWSILFIICISIAASFFDFELMLSWQNSVVMLLITIIFVEITSAKRVEILQEIFELKMKSDK